MSIDPITAGFDLGRTILDKFFPDADTELKGKLEQAASELNDEFEIQLGQIRANIEQAKHPSIFVAGARPAAMWLGVFTLAYSGIGISLLNWIAAICHWPLLQPVDTSTQEYLLGGLLGLGTLRSFDKFNKVDTRKVVK